MIDFIDINFHNNQLAVSIFRKKMSSISIERYMYSMLSFMDKN